MNDTFFYPRGLMGFRLRPSSETLKNTKECNISETVLFPSSGKGVGLLEGANINHCNLMSSMIWLNVHGVITLAKNIYNFQHWTCLKIARLSAGEAKIRTFVSRCIIINVDPETAMRDPELEPLRTLRS